MTARDVVHAYQGGDYLLSHELPQGLCLVIEAQDYTTDFKYAGKEGTRTPLKTGFQPLHARFLFKPLPMVVTVEQRRGWSSPVNVGALRLASCSP